MLPLRSLLLLLVAEEYRSCSPSSPVFETRLELYRFAFLPFAPSSCTGVCVALLCPISTRMSLILETSARPTRDAS